MSSPVTMSVLRIEIGSLSVVEGILSAKHLRSPNWPFVKKTELANIENLLYISSQAERELRKKMEMLLTLSDLKLFKEIQQNKDKPTARHLFVPRTANAKM